jgi:hypothetical protein
MVRNDCLLLLLLPWRVCIVRGRLSVVHMATPLYTLKRLDPGMTKICLSVLVILFGGGGRGLHAF